MILIDKPPILRALYPQEARLTQPPFIEGVSFESHMGQADDAPSHEIKVLPCEESKRKREPFLSLSRPLI